MNKTLLWQKDRAASPQDGERYKIMRTGETLCRWALGRRSKFGHRRYQMGGTSYRDKAAVEAEAEKLEWRKAKKRVAKKTASLSGMALRENTGVFIHTLEPLVWSSGGLAHGLGSEMVRIVPYRGRNDEKRYILKVKPKGQRQWLQIQGMKSRESMAEILEDAKQRELKKANQLTRLTPKGYVSPLAKALPGAVKDVTEGIARGIADTIPRAMEILYKPSGFADLADEAVFGKAAAQALRVTEKTHGCKAVKEMLMRGEYPKAPRLIWEQGKTRSLVDGEYIKVDRNKGREGFYLYVIAKPVAGERLKIPKWEKEIGSDWVEGREVEEYAQGREDLKVKNALEVVMKAAKSKPEANPFQLLEELGTDLREQKARGKKKRPLDPERAIEIFPISDEMRMDYLATMAVEVRTPLRHGSRELFHAQDLSDEGETHRTDLRDQVSEQIRARLREYGFKDLRKFLGQGATFEEAVRAVIRELDPSVTHLREPKQRNWLIRGKGGWKNEVFDGRKKK